jgi:hypothetical protein
MGVVHSITPVPTDIRAHRTALIERMARDLVRYESAANEADAVRSLFGRGYRMIDIAMLVGEAQMLAFQEIVAMEMGKP